MDDYETLAINSGMSNGYIVKTLKRQVPQSVESSISNLLDADNSSAVVSVKAKDVDGNETASFLLYIDEGPLQDHGILHNIGDAEIFASPDALNGKGAFLTEQNGLASGMQVSDSSIASGSVYAHNTYGNVQRITLDFSSSTSGTSVDITMPQIAYSNVTKQAAIFRYRIHASANATITSNILDNVQTDENWHTVALTVTSPIAPKFTVKSNVVNDTDKTIIEIANYFAYNLDTTPIPANISKFLQAVLGKTYATYSDLDNDALAYVRMPATVPHFPIVLNANGEYDVILALSNSTVPGMVQFTISTPTSAVTLPSDYIDGYTNNICVAIKKAPFTYVRADNSVVSVSGSAATMAKQLVSGSWRVYYPAVITLKGAVVSEQVSANGSEVLQALHFEVPVEVITSVCENSEELPDDYAFSSYQYRDAYTCTFTAK